MTGWFGKDGGMEIGSIPAHANLTKAAMKPVEIVEIEQGLERLLDCEIRRFCCPFGRFERPQLGRERATVTLTPPPRTED
jgi:hypothetical protein